MTLLDNNMVAKYLLILLCFSLLFSGCIDSTTKDIAPVQTPLPVILVTSTPTPSLGPAELKIMSLQEGLGFIRIKVKNIGESTAKDVYVGAIQIHYGPYELAKNYSELHNKKLDAIYYSWTEGQYYFDTGIRKISGDIRTGNLTVWGKLANWDYIGDLGPSEMIQIDLSVVYSQGYSYTMAWTEDKKIYTMFESID